VILFMSAIAYYILTLALLGEHGKDSAIAVALGRDFKGKISIVIYVVGIVSAFWNSAISCAIYAFVAIMWLVPDRRIEKNLVEKN
jgi:uncharacterized membrane protein